MKELIAYPTVGVLLGVLLALSACVNLAPREATVIPVSCWIQNEPVPCQAMRQRIEPARTYAFGWAVRL